MDKARVIELRETAERRCADLYNQVTTLQTELERTRGEYRAYDALLSNWPEALPLSSAEGSAWDAADIFPPPTKVAKKVKEKQ